MLKRIELADLELGMFIQKMEGSWFDHPFWKAKFVIDNKEKLETLRTSNLAGVVIDTDKGCDVATKRNSAPPAPLKPGRPIKKRVDAIQARSSVRYVPIRPVSMEIEVEAAQAIADDALERMNKTVLAARLGKALNTRVVEPVVSDIIHSVKRNPHAFSGLMRCKLQNEFTYRHSLSVSALMISLGRQMKLPDSEVREAGLAGLFLDIGTSYLPQNTEPANGDFRNAKPSIWQQHVILGHRALKNADYSLSDAILDACLQHHERIDGTGFPNGLSGGQIGRLARMAAICDSFDFLLTETEAATALDPAAAIEAMQEMEGAFDKEMLRQFIESVGLFPIGSFVELRSGKIAMVIDEDKNQSDKPVVQVFYSIPQREQVNPYRLELAKSKNANGDNDIVGIANLSKYHIDGEDLLRETIFLRANRIH